MKNFRLFTLIIIGLTVGLQSCKDEHNDSYTMENQTFVNEASSSNNFEIAAGNMAISKGQQQAVKDYGQHMVMDHSAVGAEMTSLIQTKGLIMPPATQLEAKEQANLTKLAGLTGTAFDKEFANVMVMSHQDAISLFTAASQNDGVRDPDLKNFAAAKLPALKAHLELATVLQTQVTAD